MKTWIKARIRLRRMARQKALAARIARINVRLDHLDGFSDEANALRTERAHCWRARNDILQKLYDSKE